jgi:GT2 family glycosyltransferase
MRVSVLIITLNRPDCMQRCLECLHVQTPAPDQIIVVDSSPDDRTKEVVARFPEVLYLRNPNGFGRMTASRNLGIRSATGDILAFLDDDAFAHPGWLAALREGFCDPKVGAVGGRALNNQPGEETRGIHEIGQLKPNGVLTGNFAADPGKVLEVRHIMGCNMAFRREVVAQLGGFREDYIGISGVREDTDMCLRVGRLGYKILFVPAACVDHLGAPQAVGQRFDTRYAFDSERNHLILLIRNFGLFAPVVWRYLLGMAGRACREFLRRLGGAFLRPGAILGGAFVGLLSGIRLLFRTGRDPVRHDPDAQTVRTALEKRP